MKREYTCKYCGDMANTIDHIIPDSYIHSQIRTKNKGVFSDIDNLVESCEECNKLAYNKIFNSFEEKKEYIQNRLAIRYARLLKLPKWEEEEIEEMGWKFKNDLNLSMLAKKWIINRINYPEIIYEDDLNTNSLKEILKEYNKE